MGEAQAGKLATEAKRKGIARLTFKDAAERFTADRSPNITVSSGKTERERARAVSRVLGSRTVASISPEDVLAYIRTRKVDGKSNATVNRELDIIRGVLKKAKRWHRFADEIKPLRKTENIGRALLHEEKVKLLHCAAMRPSWQSAYYAAVLTFNTTCRGCELKGIQWRDVDLVNRTITIREEQAAAGHRVIPLNSDALRVIMLLYRRAEKMGSPRPDAHVSFSLPASAGTLTQVARKEAGAQPGEIYQSGRPTRPEISRCQASCDHRARRVSNKRRDYHEHRRTRLAEDAGAYSHIRLDAKRTALDGISMGRAGYDTNNDTNREKGLEEIPQVIESLVELVGIEPTASSLRTTRSPS